MDTDLKLAKVREGERAMIERETKWSCGCSIR
jgi:hypothetical protein